MLSFSLIFETYLHPLHIYILFNNYLSDYYLLFTLSFYFTPTFIFSASDIWCHKNWSCYFFIEQFHIQHDKTRVCLETDGRNFISTVCDDKNQNQIFKFRPTGHNEGNIESIGQRKCLADNGSGFTWRSCSDASRYSSNMIWTCHTPLTEKGGMWQDRDWVGLKLKSAKVCFIMLLFCK